MSDNEDLLGDDLGEYTLGNEDEDKLLADNYIVEPTKQDNHILKSVNETKQVGKPQVAQMKTTPAAKPARALNNIKLFKNIQKEEFTIGQPLQDKCEDFSEDIKLDPPSIDEIVSGGDVPGRRGPQKRGNQKLLTKVQKKRLPNIDNRAMMRGPPNFMPGPPFPPRPPHFRRFEMGNGDFQQRGPPPQHNHGPALPYPLKPPMPLLRHGGPPPRMGPPLRPPGPPRLGPLGPPPPGLLMRPLMRPSGPPMMFRPPPPNFPHMPRPHFRPGPPGPVDFGPGGHLARLVQPPRPPPKNNEPNEPKQAEQIEQQVVMNPIPTITSKKVLINPHFKGHINIIEGNSIEDAAERFIAEQRLVLARNNNRNIVVRVDRRADEPAADSFEGFEERVLLRKQEDFIKANRAGLRRRMRSPTPPSPPPERKRRSPPPVPYYRPSARERTRLEPKNSKLDKELDHEALEYRRKVRHRDELRTKILRAKEERRRANAHQRLEDERKRKERDSIETEKEDRRLEAAQDEPAIQVKTAVPIIPVEQPKSVPKPAPVEMVPALERVKPDTTTSHDLKPHHVDYTYHETASPEPPVVEEDEALELDMALDELQEMLNAGEDEIIENIKKKREAKANKLAAKAEVPAPKPAPTTLDLRSKLPPKPVQQERPRQRIIFELNNAKNQERKQLVSSKPEPREEKTLLKRNMVSPPEVVVAKKPNLATTETKVKASNAAFKPIFTRNNEMTRQGHGSTPPPLPKSSSTRRVVLQRSADQKPVAMSIFSKALSHIRVEKGNANEPTVIIEGKLEKPSVDFGQNDGIARRVIVDNLPPGMTELRLKTLAGDNCSKADIKRDLSRAELTFTGQASAQHFYKRFNNRTVAACLLKLTML